MAKKAISTPARIRNSVAGRSREGIFPPIMALVRALLEYSVHFWSPHYKKGIEVPEESRAAKLVKELVKRRLKEVLSLSTTT